MRAVKGNKVYTILESQKKSYNDMGFDILDDDGNIIAHGKGKTVSMDDYEKLKKEMEELKEKEDKSDNKDCLVVLNKYVEEHSIDIGNAKAVSGILKKIKEAEPEIFQVTEGGAGGE